MTSQGGEGGERGFSLSVPFVTNFRDKEICFDASCLFTDEWGCHYLHPFLSIRRQLGPGELWGGGNTDSQAGRPERRWHRFTCQNPPTALQPAPGAVKRQKKVQEKFAENGTYQTEHAFAEGPRFTLCRGCLCFPFLEISGMPLIQRGRKQGFCLGEGEGKEASTLILQPSFLIRNQPKDEKKPSFPNCSSCN